MQTKESEQVLELNTKDKEDFLGAEPGEGQNQSIRPHKVAKVQTVNTHRVASQCNGPRKLRS